MIRSAAPRPPTHPPTPPTSWWQGCRGWWGWAGMWLSNPTTIIKLPLLRTNCVCPTIFPNPFPAGAVLKPAPQYLLSFQNYAGPAPLPPHPSDLYTNMVMTTIVHKIARCWLACGQPNPSEVAKLAQIPWVESPKFYVALI